jgi:hypothetical protein
MNLIINKLRRVLLLRYYKFIKKKSFSNNIKSDIKIDIIIPTIEKDLFSLEFLLISINKYLKHRIGNIYIVAPNEQQIVLLVNKFGCIHLIEQHLDLISKSEINYYHNNVNRSGWIFQQLIKLNADSISKEEFLFVIDADTVLTTNQIFHVGGKCIFLCSDEYHEPYYITFEKIFGYKVKSKISFVAHQILFNRFRLLEMKNEIELKHNKRWDCVISSLLDHNENSSFSEYEIYANWMFIHYPDEITIEYYCNKSFRNSNQFINFINNNLSNKRSCSLHSYDFIS